MARHAGDAAGSEHGAGGIGGVRVQCALRSVAGSGASIRTRPPAGHVWSPRPHSANAWLTAVEFVEAWLHGQAHQIA